MCVCLSDGCGYIPLFLQKMENSSLLVRTTSKKKSRPSIPTHEFSIKLGFLSSTNPRPVDIIFKNRNPVRVPIALVRSNHNVTLCWRVAQGFGDRAVRDSLVSTTTNFLEANRSEYIFSACDNYPPISSKVTYPNKTFELRAEHVVGARLFIQPLDSNGPGSVEVKFQTPYQYFHFHLPFVSVPGVLVNSYHAEDADMMMGVRSTIPIRSLSTFGDTININSVQSSAPLIPAVFSEFHDSVHENGGVIRSEGVDDDGFLTAHLVSPYLQCLEPFGPLQRLSMWSCAGALLEEWIRYHRGNASMERDVLKYQDVLDCMRPIEPLITASEYASALIQIDNLRQKWQQVTRRGLPLPPVDVLFRASFTHSMLHVTDIHLQLPLVSMPMFSAFDLPAAEHGQVLLVSFILRNPFDVPIKFDLAYDDFLPPASFEEHHLCNRGHTTSNMSDEWHLSATSHLSPHPVTVSGADSPNLDTLHAYPGRFLDLQQIRVQRRRLDIPAPNHPLFSRVQFAGYPPSHQVIAPREEAEIGTIAFVPAASIHEISAYNMSIVVTNPYTGFHQVHCTFHAGVAVVRVRDVTVLSAQGPELEPVPSPAQVSVVVAVTDGERGAKKADAKLAGPAGLVTQQVVSLTGVNRSFWVTLSLGNAGTVPADVDRIVLNGRKVLCSSSSSIAIAPSGPLALLQTLFMATPPSTLYVPSCDDMPFVLEPQAAPTQVRVLVSTDCTVDADSARLSFVSEVRKAIMLDVLLEFQLAEAVKRDCHHVNFESDGPCHSMGRLLCVLLLIMLGFQLRQQCRLLPHKIGDGDIPDRSGRDVLLRSPRVDYGHEGGEVSKPDSLSIPTPSTRKHVSGFSYVRKGISLSDVQAGLPLDEQSVFLEAVETLKQRRISTYYGDRQKARGEERMASERDDDKSARESAESVSTVDAKGTLVAATVEASSTGIAVPAKGSTAKSKKEKGARRGKVTEEHRALSESPAATAGATIVEKIDESAGSPTSTGRAAGVPNAGAVTVVIPSDAPLKSTGEGKDSVAALPKSPPPPGKSSLPHAVSNKASPTTAVAVQSQPCAATASETSECLDAVNRPRPPPSHPTPPVSAGRALSEGNHTIRRRGSPENGQRVAEVQVAPQDVPSAPQNVPPAPRPPQTPIQSTFVSETPPEGRRGGFVRPPALSIPPAPAAALHGEGGMAGIVPTGGAEREREQTRVDLSIDPSEALVIAPSLSDSGNNLLGKRTPVFAGQHTPRMYHSTPSASPAMATHAMGTHAPAPALGAPPGLASPLTPLGMPDRLRSISKGLESMVAGIVDTDSYDNLSSLGEGPMEAFGTSTRRGQIDMSPTHNPVYTTTDTGRAPQAVKSPPSAAPPGFAGALGIYAAPLYEGSLFSSPSFFTDTHQSTPPSTGLRSPAHAHSQSVLSSMFALPAAMSTVPPEGAPPGDDDDLGWAAILTMPLEDMMQVEARGMGLAPHTHRPHHYSPSSDAARTPASLSTGSAVTPPSGSSLETFFRSPPMTASDVYGASQGHHSYQTHALRQQAPVVGGRPVHLFDEQGARGGGGRGLLHSQDMVYAPGGGDGGAGRGDWSSREMRLAVSQPVQQQQFYRPPQQQQPYRTYPPPTHHHHQQSYQQFQPQHHLKQPSSQHQQQHQSQPLQQRLGYGSSDRSAPLTHDDLVQHSADPADWPEEWTHMTPMPTNDSQSR